MSGDQGFSRFRAGGVAILLLSASAIAVLWAAQRAGVQREAEQRRTAAEAGPRVRVVAVRPGGAERVLELPGESAPFVSASIYAKTSGFLKEIRVDKGSVVKAGQVLAVLESPELERDTQALKADADNKASYARRLAQLGGQGIVSARDLEDAEAAARIAREKLASQAVLLGYTQVLAPFAGVVTQRFADPGAMIQNGGASSAAQPLLALAQVGRLRVAFYLDQAVAGHARVGQPVAVHPADRPDLRRVAKVSRLAGALDARTRTLLVEADLDNGDGAFLPGAAVLVHLRLPAAAGRLEIPPEAVIPKGDQNFVALLGQDGRIRIQAVLLGEDSGTRIQVLKGLEAGGRVVLNPPAGLQEGDKVQGVEIGG